MKKIPIKIKTTTHAIYGVFSGTPHASLVIFVHGFPGSMDDALYQAAAEHFQTFGFATFRFNLYGHQKDAGQAMRVTLASQAKNLDVVVRHFRKKGAGKICVVGHSLGGPIILSSKAQDFDAVALWDPSYNLSFTKPIPGTRPPIYVKQLQAYVMQWGSTLVVSKKLVDELDTFPWKTVTKDFLPRFKLFIAGKGVLRTAKNYLKSARPGNEATVIETADHDFADLTSQKALFEATAHWFMG